MCKWPSDTKGYKLLYPVGVGTYGLVWCAECIDSNSVNVGKKIAIKIIDMDEIYDF